METSTLPVISNPVYSLRELETDLQKLSQKTIFSINYIMYTRFSNSILAIIKIFFNIDGMTVLLMNLKQLLVDVYRKLGLLKPQHGVSSKNMLRSNSDDASCPQKLWDLTLVGHFVFSYIKILQLTRPCFSQMTNIIMM